MLSTPLISHLSFLLVILALLHLTRPVYLAFTRRRRAYGVVFDSLTGIPLPLVTVRLVTPGAFARQVASAVTDKHGRYRLLGRPGEFMVEVVKSGYNFPSQYLKGHTTVYDNLLQAPRIILKDYGMLTKNLPVDPSQDARRSQIFRRQLPALPKNTQFMLAYVSPLLLLIYPLWILPSVIGWLLYAGYLSVMLYRLFTFKPSQAPFGVIRNVETGETVQGAIVRVLSSKFNKVLETQVTGPRGRYAFVVHPGAYYVLIKKEGYKTVRINFPPVKKEGTLLAKDLSLKLAPETPGERAEKTDLEPTASAIGYEGL